MYTGQAENKMSIEINTVKKPFNIKYADTSLNVYTLEQPRKFYNVSKPPFTATSLNNNILGAEMVAL